MDKLPLTGQNQGRVFNFRSGHLHAAAFLVSSVKLPNLQLKTRPKQFLGSLPLVIVLPDSIVHPHASDHVIHIATVTISIGDMKKTEKYLTNI